MPNMPSTSQLSGGMAEKLKAALLLEITNKR